VSPSQLLTTRILALPGVQLRGGNGRPAFYVGERRFARFFTETLIGIRLTRSRIESLARELARDPRVSVREDSDWLLFSCPHPDDLGRAMDLVRTAFDANAKAAGGRA